MRRAINSLILASVLAFGASCGGEEPPPEGFHLFLRFTSLDPSVLDDVAVNFEPQGGGRFMAIEPISYEDGAISMQVAPDGVLEMSIQGSHIAANAEEMDGAYIYDLEIWSMDEEMIPTAPSVRVVGHRGGEDIAEGFLFLVRWPLPLGASSTVQVPCRMAVLDRCVP